MPPPRVALITCSTRKLQLGTFISQHVSKIISTSPSFPSISLVPLDISSQNLPFFDEPGIPQYFPAADPTPHYTHAHTRAWSTLIRSLDAFIFVTPQYNRSLPAEFKNSLDFLFHEWCGKPAAIVSYGGHGGHFAALHLKDIINGLRKVLVEPQVQLFKYDVDIEKCVEEGQVESRISQRWTEEGKDGELVKMIEDLVEKLEEKKVEK